MESLKIEIPEGKVIDLERSDLSKCLICFKDDKPKLPTTWEELGKVEGYFIDEESNILNTSGNHCNDANINIFPTEELAEAALALAQLLQLRDKYNDGWIPDWNDSTNKFSIVLSGNHILKSYTTTYARVLIFKTPELRDLFLENFRDLIEVAKPLV